MRREMNSRLTRTKQMLDDLIRADDDSVEVNIRYGLIGVRNYTLHLTKQMTLDAYTDNSEEDAKMSFPVLDVTVNKNIFKATRQWDVAMTPEGLAIEIHKSARKLPNYEIR
tara:strand:+ start:1137 stop:1469 length:333 start_codon:yes stop_codon:yes gene_type:complete